MNLPNIDAQVAESIQEDLGGGDITAELISSSEQAIAEIISRESAVICGIPWVNKVYQKIDTKVQLDWKINEGDLVVPNQVLVHLRGSARSLVTGERCALNWLQTLSGTSTLVAQFLDVLKGMPTQLLDTRKTVPGLRLAQKYAVRCGGGFNHRMGLYDAFLIKENHLANCGSIAKAVTTARNLDSKKLIEIEVENLDQFAQALEVGADIILLDNFSLNEIKQAVALNQGKAKIEVSGDVSLENVRQIAATGVNYISVGGLTKHIRAVDLSMRFI